MGFAERIGAVSVRKALQVDDLDIETRTAIWNTLHKTQSIVYENYDQDGFIEALENTWSANLHRRLDLFGADRCWNAVRTRILEEDWFLALDVTEYLIAELIERTTGYSVITEVINDVMERYLVGYRLVNVRFVPVTDSVEVDEIDAAILNGSATAGARSHLRNAVTLLADRADPQYAKSLGESVNAVEAEVQSIVGSRVSLGDGLKLLEKKGYSIHPALREGWMKLYGYTSASGGIRHGSMDPSDVDEKLASYFLVSCSAFVNLLTKVQSGL
jgi:hypothetical protein